MLNDPYFVTLMSAAGVLLVTKAGRRLRTPSPSISPPVVMLNGEPDCIVTNGAACTPYGNCMVPPK
jgi:hypothetical protein